MTTLPKIALKLVKKTVSEEKNLLEVLFSISSKVLTAETLKQLLDSVIALSVDFFDSHFGTIWEVSGDELKIISSKGLDRKTIKRTTIKLGEGIPGWVAEKGEPILVENIDNDMRFKNIPLSVYFGKTSITAPIRVKEKIFGVICLSDKKNNKPYIQEDLLYLSAIVNQTAIAIETMLAYQEVNIRVKELKTIFETGQAIVSTLNLKDVLQTIVEKTVQIMNVSVCSLRLLDEEKKELFVVASYGLSEDYLKKGPLKLGESIAGRVAKQGKPISVYNLSEDLRVKFPDFADREGLKSLLCVPIMFKEISLGVITIYTTTPYQFTEDEVRLLSTFASQAAIAIENAQLYERVNRNYLSTIQALALAVEARDPYTRGHSERVTQYALEIAKELNLSESEIKVLQYAGRLHDIGKIAIPDSILSKPDKLTITEKAVVQLHPEKGVEMIEPLEFLRIATPLIKSHHERYNGKGYPEGLQAQEIPLMARILCVADAFDAMTSERPYRRALSIEEAIKEMEIHSGKQFDPEVVKAFRKVIESKKLK